MVEVWIFVGKSLLGQSYCKLFGLLEKKVYIVKVIIISQIFIFGISFKIVSVSVIMVKLLINNGCCLVVFNYSIGGIQLSIKNRLIIMFFSVVFLLIFNFNKLMICGLKV